jgi:glycosyltransferase involved in cell wall biosynthesis
MSTKVVRRRNVCLIGIFAPGSGGQAAVNESFRRQLDRTGVPTSVLDLSPRNGPATVARRLSRIPKVVVGVVRLTWLVANRKVASIYIGVSGGYGQIYDLLFLAVSRLATVPLYLHHDSFAYLDRRSVVTGLVVRLAGPTATHLVLCDLMGTRLQKLYPGVRETLVISNVTNTDEPEIPPHPHQQLNSIGFFSNLTRAKGVLEFLDLAEQVCRARPGLRAWLAGPVEEPKLGPILRDRLRSAPWVEYLGPVYGEARAQFLANLDVLVFPTRYANEAEPKVISEALACGIVVVARDRGCIGSLLSSHRGVSIPASADFIGTVMPMLLEWTSNAEEFSSLSASALRGYRQLRDEQSHRLRFVVEAMAASTHS